MKPDAAPAVRETILLVDDAPANLALLADCLGTAGLAMRFAESGERALTLLDRGVRPDLVLLDVLMPPGLDGFATCARLRARADCRDVPILFMTSLADTPDTLRGFEAGAVDYIAKPFRPEEVLARVRVHLQLRALRRTLEAEVHRRERAEAQLRQGLDRAVIALDADGTVGFCSRLARDLVGQHFAGPELGEGDALPGELRRLADAARVSGAPATRPLDGGGGLRVRLFSEVSGEDGRGWLLFLEELPPPAAPETLMALGLTAREAEVLYWVAQAKTTGEIARILDSAPKTVTKHLEHIFNKLGVDSRTAAACRALEHLGRRGTAAAASPAAGASSGKVGRV